MRRTSLLPTVLALAVLAGAALFMGQAAAGEVPRTVAWTVIALAVIAIGWNLLARRRR